MIIVFLGVVGNILVCFVIFGWFRKICMNYYLLSLVIVDLGVLIGFYLMFVVKYISLYCWELGRVVCLYVMLMEEIFFGVFVWLIIVIVVERYINIVGFWWYWFGKIFYLRIRLMIVGVWLLFFFVLFVLLYLIMNDKLICVFVWLIFVMYYMYLIFFIVVWYIFLLVVIVFMYVKIR